MKLWLIHIAGRVVMIARETLESITGRLNEAYVREIGRLKCI